MKTIGRSALVGSKLICVVLVILSAFWAGLAFWFQLPFEMIGRIVGVIVWVIFVALLLFAMRAREYRLPAFLLYGTLLAGTVLWWTQLIPRLDRDWDPDVALTVTGFVNEEVVTLDNVRDFDWRATDDFIPRWERRSYDLSSLTTVDVILSTWGIDAIAHTLVSFGFADGEHVVFSVEIRREKGESFSEIGGFFKQYELAFIAATERDIG